MRLPESGRGAPCGRPSQGITSRTVQTVVRYRKFSTSLATGGRFLGRKKKTIGRGAPCGRPSQGITPGTVQIVVRYRKFHTSLATGSRFLGRKKKTIGRGAPCGCPSSAILASELRCVCPGWEASLLDEPRSGMLYSSVLKQLAPFLTRGLFLTVRDAQNASGRRGSDSFSMHLLGRADTSTSSQRELL